VGKEQKREPWEEVYNRIHLYHSPDWIRVPRPSDAELDRVEAQLGSRLPRSYREFLKRFGPGELAHRLRLTPISVTNRPNFTLVEETVENRTFFSTRKAKNKDWLERVVYYGCNAGGDFYAWDPNELVNSTDGECPVYWLPCHDEDDPQAQAGSFFEFVRVVLARVEECREDDEEEETTGPIFHPYTLRMKTAPSETEVFSWLAFNNNTARDLAFSIHDRGQTDAFPILADALEEAGCTNADLLDSCCTGDPDIDGAWVLQVLLGKA
jgi:hypothetical protein